ncbi:MAG: heparinase II/III family protein [Alphaproteobacteria bacterium]|nr:heparinase II/III family protein [Alphaproteobacteria bacterium]
MMRLGDVAGITAEGLSHAAGSALAEAVRPFRNPLATPRRQPSQLLHHPADPRRGDPTRARAFVAGQYRLPGGLVTTPEGGAPWTAAPPTPLFAETLHGFDWLHHFQGEDDARAHARWLVQSWIEAAAGFPPAVWRAPLLARRLVSWLTGARLLLSGADEPFRTLFLGSLVAQSRFLSAIAGGTPPGYGRIVVHAALALIGASLPGRGRCLDRGLNGMATELNRQILPDGGHVSRNPALVLYILRDITVVQDAMSAVSKAMPEAVYGTVMRMAPMLRFFCHGDGGFGLFNGAREEDGELIALMIERHHPSGRAFGVAPHARYQRLAAGGTVILVDTGAPPQGRASRGAHASALAFEMSVGPERLITNCGTGVGLPPGWAEAMRATAAHSTLTVADTSSCRYLGTGLLGGWSEGRVIAGPTKVLSRRNEEERGIWLATSHDGYLEPFGLVHERRIYMNNAGSDIRGEDRLLQIEQLSPEDLRDLEPLPFAVRFHLHPSVRIDLRPEEGSAQLRLPSGDGWIFRSAGGGLSIEESVYLGTPDMVPTRQIVVSGGIGADTTVKWALTRMARPGGVPVS